MRPGTDGDSDIVVGRRAKSLVLFFQRFDHFLGRSPVGAERLSGEATATIGQRAPIALGGGAAIPHPFVRPARNYPDWYDLLSVMAAIEALTTDARHAFYGWSAMWACAVAVIPQVVSCCVHLYLPVLQHNRALA